MKREILYMNGSGEIIKYDSIAAKREATFSKLFERRYEDFVYLDEAAKFAEKYRHEKIWVSEPTGYTKTVEVEIKPHWKSFGHRHCADTWHEGGVITTKVAVFKEVEAPSTRAILAQKVYDFLNFNS